jgi:ADP-ribose pyrophosphatase YjhB (NUDIX family)
LKETWTLELFRITELLNYYNEVDFQYKNCKITYHQKEGSMADKSTGVSVAALIESDKRLLCVKQSDEKGGKWGIPAGHLKPGEMILDGVKREIREETGYEITLFGLVGVYNRPKEDSVRVALVFTACIVGGEENPRPDEIAEIKWLSRDEVRSLLTSGQLYRPEYSARVLMDWMAGTVYSLDVFKEIR